MSRIARTTTALILILFSSPTIHAQEDSPLNMRIITQEFQGCLNILQSDLWLSDTQSGHEMGACHEFMQITWAYRPVNRSGWSNTLEWQPLQQDLVGSGQCLRTARLLQDEEKRALLLAFFDSVWAELANRYANGQSQEFAIRASEFARQVHTAITRPTEWQRTPDAQYWNTNCAGFFGAARDDVFQQRQEAADFTLSGTQTGVIIRGRIEEGFARDLVQWLDSRPMVRSLVLSSLGGDDVFEAMDAGRLIRERGFFTHVSGSCESACALLFIAGQMRHVGGRVLLPAGDETSGVGRLGFHRLSSSGLTLPDDSMVYELISDYLSSMNARPELVIDFMTRNDGLDFYYPSLEELCHADVIGIALMHSPFLVGQSGSNCVTHRMLERYDFYLEEPN
jgi:hypothetical protein